MPGLIVVGSTHTGRAGRVLPGSTAERLLHGSPCPVAVAPKGYRGARWPRARDHRVWLRRLALCAARARGRPPHGGGDRLALARDPRVQAARLRRRRQAASPWAVIALQRLAAATAPSEALDAAVAQLEGDPRGRVRSSPSARPRDILAEASEDLDLLLVGSRGYGPLHSVVVGGVAGRVVREAACPVIVLPRTRRPRRGGLAVRRSRLACTDSAVTGERVERLRRNHRDEIDSAVLYDAMASAEHEERLAGVYRGLAAAERRHAAGWAELARAARRRSAAGAPARPRARASCGSPAGSVPRCSCPRWPPASRSTGAVTRFSRRPATRSATRNDAHAEAYQRAARLLGARAARAQALRLRT